MPWVVLLLALRAPSPVAQDAVEVVARVDQALVHLATADVTGSGFLLGDARTIVTNRHVVESAGVGGRVEVRTIVAAEDGATDLSAPEEGVVVALHPRLDLAVVERRADAVGGEPLVPFPDRRLLPRGTAVLVHGFPGTMDPIVARGILSGHHREVASETRTYLLDAAIGSGSSGGPVTDLEGRLVGVVTAIYLPDGLEESGFNWGFAIPLRDVLELFDAEGRVRRSAVPVPVRDLVDVVTRAAEADRLARVEDGMQAVLDTRAGARSVCEALGEFLEGTLPVVRVASAEEARRLVATLLRTRQVATEVGTELYLRGDVTPEEEEAWRLFAKRQQALGERISGAVLDGPGDGPTVALLDAFREEVERRLARADGAEQALRAYLDATSVELRELDPRTVRSGVVDLVMLDAGRGLAGHLEAVDEERRAQRPAAWQRAYRAFVEAVERARRRLEGLEPDVLDLLDSLEWAPEREPVDPRAVRAWLRGEGLHRAGPPERLTLDPGPTELRRRAPRGAGEWAVLAVAAGGEDVDLGMVDAADGTRFFDGQPDGCPLLWIDAPGRGSWTITVINQTAGPVEVEVEQWRD